MKDNAGRTRAVNEGACICPQMWFCEREFSNRVWLGMAMAGSAFKVHPCTIMPKSHVLCDFPYGIVAPDKKISPFFVTRLWTNTCPFICDLRPAGVIFHAFDVMYCLCYTKEDAFGIIIDVFPSEVTAITDATLYEASLR